MGTYYLCSTLHRFPVYYPDCLVRHGCCLPKPLQTTATITTTTTITTVSSYVCQERRLWRKPITAVILAAAAAVIVALNGAEAAVAAAEVETQQEILGETFSNVPQTLSGGDCSGDGGEKKDCKKTRIQRPKSRQAETCTVKCVNTCIRGGSGSPGEGPLNVRRPLVVFKQGFRSRQYCLVECSDICNLMKDGEDGP